MDKRAKQQEKQEFLKKVNGKIKNVIGHAWPRSDRRYQCLTHSLSKARTWFAIGNLKLLATQYVIAHKSTMSVSFGWFVFAMKVVCRGIPRVHDGVGNFLLFKLYFFLLCLFILFL
jgi:hypothetical protein